MNMPIDTIARWSAQLRKDGYVVIPDALPAATIAALDADLAPTFDATPFCQGSFYGETTKRFGRLLTRSDHMAALVQHRTILTVVEQMLSPWCDTIQLNVAQAIAVHPGAPAQLPHRDQAMWCGPVGEIEYLVNLGHAPTLLAANGLDICVGHPAAFDNAGQVTLARFSSLGARAGHWQMIAQVACFASRLDPRFSVDAQRVRVAIAPSRNSPKLQHFDALPCVFSLSVRGRVSLVWPSGRRHGLKSGTIRNACA